MDYGRGDSFFLCILNGLCFHSECFILLFVKLIFGQQKVRETGFVEPDCNKN